MKENVSLFSQNWVPTASVGQISALTCVTYRVIVVWIANHHMSINRLKTFKEEQRKHV